MERWKHIDGCHYDVSNLGQVRNSETGRILKGRQTKRKYLRVHISVNGKRKEHYIHRLVAEAFCCHPDGCNVINHIDNNPENNRFDNLEWTTQFNNVHYGMKQRRYRLNAVPVVGYKDGKKFIFSSAHEAGKETGCDHSMIIKCCKGKRKATNGYRWEYMEVPA